MFRRRIVFPILALLVFSSQAVYPLSKTLEEMISEKGIIMPDLAERYPDAEAVIIIDEKDVEQSRIINPVYIGRHIAVKILKESAVEKFRTVKIPYYEEVKVNEIEARTINDGQIIKVRDIPNRELDLEGVDKGFIYPLELGNNLYAVRGVELNTSPTAGDLLKISDSQVFHKKKDKIWRIRQIDFPEVRVGSVIEYSYRIEQKRVVLYDRFRFMSEYPILKASYTLRNAKLMRFTYMPNNFMRKPETVFENRFTNLESQYNNRVRNSLRTIDVTNKPENWQFYGHVFFQIALDTVDAYPAHVPFAPSFGDMCPRVDFWLREVMNIWAKGATDFRIRKESFSPNWNYPIHRMTTDYIVSDRQARKAKQTIAEVIVDCAGPEEKVSAAVAWARENLKNNGELDRWDSYFWSSKPMAPDDLLRVGEGNSDDINYFLVSALQLNDLLVYPFYAKTRGRGRFLDKVFTETQFDASLLALEVGSRRFKVWQPCTDIPVPPDYLDYNLEGVTGMVNRSGKDDITFNKINTRVSKAEDNSYELTGSLTLDANGTAAGKIEQSLKGHFSVDMHRKLKSGAEKERADIWLGTINGTFEDKQLDGPLNMEAPAVLTDKYSTAAEVSLSGFGRISEDGLVIKASVVTDPYCAALDGEERNLDVVFPYKADFKTSLEVKIPDGYMFPDSLPKPVEMKTRGLYYNRVVAKQGPNTLLIKRDFMMSSRELPVRSFNRRYAKIFKKIRENDTMELVLKKK